MNKSSTHTRKVSRISPQSGYIRVDAYILLAEAAILAILVIIRFAIHLNDEILLKIMQTLLVLAAFGTIGLAAYRSFKSIHNMLAARGVAISASLGSLLCSLLVVVLLSEGQGSLLIVIAMCMGIVAIAVFGIVMLLTEEEDVVNIANEQPAQRMPMVQPATEQHVRNRQTVMPVSVVPPPSRQYQGYSQQPYPPSQWGQLNIHSREAPVALSPLFEDDPLYAVPHSEGRVRLFLQIKSNDISVNGEDACAISLDETRFALCDGVSSSSFSRPWATLLAHQWVTQPSFAHNAESINQWLIEPRQRWKQWIRTTWLPTINKRNQELGQVIFSREDAEKFIAMGAASTFLGVSVNREIGRWSAVSVGDTCLFHYSASDNTIIDWFPLESFADFTDAPASISSGERTSMVSLSKSIRYKEAEYKEGDFLFMATDAFAAWLFKQLERENPRLENILRFSQEEFARLVDQQRAAKQMNDDDTTLLVVKLPGGNR